MQKLRCRTMPPPVDELCSEFSAKPLERWLSQQPPSVIENSFGQTVFTVPTIHHRCSKHDAPDLFRTRNEYSAALILKKLTDASSRDGHYNVAPIRERMYGERPFLLFLRQKP